MDGPNVNKAFENKLLTCLKEDNGTEFLKLGTCSLHKVHNAFYTGLKELNILDLILLLLQFTRFLNYLVRGGRIAQS